MRSNGITTGTISHLINGQSNDPCEAESGGMSSGFFSGTGGIQAADDKNPVLAEFHTDPAKYGIISAIE